MTSKSSTANPFHSPTSKLVTFCFLLSILSSFVQFLARHFLAHRDTIVSRFRSRLRSNRDTLSGKVTRFGHRPAFISFPARTSEDPAHHQPPSLVTNTPRCSNSRLVATNTLLPKRGDPRLTGCLSTMAPIPFTSTAAELLPRVAAFTSHLAERLSKRIPHALSSLPHTAQIARRQNSGTAVIPSVYKLDGPQPAAVAGIVLGSVAGFILIILLLFFLSGNTPSWTITGENQEIAVVRREDGGPSSRGHRRSRGSRSERVEVRERSPRVRTAIVEETTRRESRRPPSIVSERIVMDSRRGSRGPPPIRRVDGDDIVEVIEEGSSIGDAPPRRDRRRRSSGYRSVDPHRFAGGDYPRIVVEKRGSSTSYS
jgi:hypothetical protein